MSTLLRSAQQPYGIVTTSDARQPMSLDELEEWELEKFCARSCPDLFDAGQLRNWWLPEQAKIPQGATWDLISMCTIDGRRGLLLVEAKAHESELNRGGKAVPSGSDQSAVNDQ